MRRPEAVTLSKHSAVRSARSRQGDAASSTASAGSPTTRRTPRVTGETPRSIHAARSAGSPLGVRLAQALPVPGSLSRRDTARSRHPAGEVPAIHHPPTPQVASPPGRSPPQPLAGLLAAARPRGPRLSPSQTRLHPQRPSPRKGRIRNKTRAPREQRAPEGRQGHSQRGGAAPSRQPQPPDPPPPPT